MMSGLNRDRSGFTLVELLIVIVVIAILAAISIVAYNGIQNRARVTTLVDTIAKIDKGMRLYITAEGTGGWPLESSFGAGANPNINTIIADTELSNYLQTLDPVQVLPVQRLSTTMTAIATISMTAAKI